MGTPFLEYPISQSRCPLSEALSVILPLMVKMRIIELIHIKQDTAHSKCSKLNKTNVSGQKGKIIYCVKLKFSCVGPGRLSSELFFRLCIKGQQHLWHEAKLT